MSRPEKIGSAEADDRRRLDPTKTMAAVAAVLVMAAGIAYMLLREPGWESRASVTLEPGPLVNGNRVGLLDVFDRSGTLGTYVERISSDDTLEAAGSPPIDVEARSIPDTRVIEVFATANDGEAAEEGLEAVVAVVTDEPPLLTAAERREMDLWTVEPTEQPSEPARGGPSDAVLGAASIALAALAGLVVLALGRRTLLEPHGSSKSRTLEETPTPRSKSARAANGGAPMKAGQTGRAP